MGRGGGREGQQGCALFPPVCDPPPSVVSCDPTQFHDHGILRSISLGSRQRPCECTVPSNWHKNCLCQWRDEQWGRFRKVQRRCALLRPVQVQAKVYTDLVAHSLKAAARLQTRRVLYLSVLLQKIGTHPDLARSACLIVHGPHFPSGIALPLRCKFARTHSDKQH